MNIDDKLSQVFDVEPLGETQTEIVETDFKVVSTENALDDDYTKTRNNLHGLLEQGKIALNAALAVAQQSEHPRAFEVVSGLMKDLADINGKLIDLHKKKQAIDLASEAPKNSSGASNVTNNAIFVGSTADLGKMLDDLRKGK